MLVTFNWYSLLPSKQSKGNVLEIDFLPKIHLLKGNHISSVYINSLKSLSFWRNAGKASGGAVKRCFVMQKSQKKYEALALLIISNKFNCICARKFARWYTLLQKKIEWRSPNQKKENKFGNTITSICISVILLLNCWYIFWTNICGVISFAQFVLKQCLKGRTRCF